MAEVQKEVVRKGLEIYQHRINMAQARQETINEKVTHATALKSIEAAIDSLRVDEKNARLQQQLSSIDIHATTALLMHELRQDRLDTNKEMSAAEDMHQPRMDTISAQIYSARRIAARDKTKAAIAAAELLAAAEIITTMTHSIGKA
jgi:hypothetical protein